MKKRKSTVETKRLGYIIRYVPHNVIADHNATYNVEYKGQHVFTRASKKLGVPLNEIWISELWKSYEEFILFHELQEIHHRRNGSTSKKAHQRAIEDTPEKWKKNPEFLKMVSEIERMDAETSKNRKGR